MTLKRLSGEVNESQRNHDQERKKIYFRFENFL